MLIGIAHIPTEQAKAADKQATLALAASYGGIQDDASLQRYVLNFDVTGAAIGGGTWNNNTVYIDGVAKTSSGVDGVNYLYDSSTNVLSLYLTYAQVEEGKTTAASIGKHSLVIKKGTVIGDTEITNDVAIVLNADTITKATPIKLTYAGGGAQDGNIRYALDFTVDGATGLGDTYWNNNTVYVDERAESGDGVNYLGSGTTLSLYLTYAHIQSGVSVHTDLNSFMLKIADGTIFGTNASNYLVSTSDLGLQINQNEIVEAALPDVTLELLDDASRNQSGTNTGGFYFFGSEPDTLPNDVTNWTQRYSMTTGGIYHNDTVVPGAKLVKLTETLYYVAFDGTGVSFATNDTVKIAGTVVHNDYVVQYEAQTFEYDGNGNWTIKQEESTDATDITITDVGECGAQADMNRWLLRLNTSAEIAGEAWSMLAGNYNITVNDAAATGDIHVTDAKGLVLFVPLSTLPQTVTDGTKITVPAGDIGTYKLTEDFTLIYSEGAWKKYDASTPTNYDFTITGFSNGGAQPDMSRWLLECNTSINIEGSGYLFIENRDLKIQTPKGAESTVQVEYCTLGDGKLTLLIPFANLPQAAEGYVLTIPAGAIGKYQLTESFTMRFSGGEWKEFDPSAGFTKFKITGLGQGGAQPDMSRWLIGLNTSVEITEEAYAVLIAETVVLVDGKETVVAFYPNDKKGLAMILPFDAVPETPKAGTTVTIPAGVYGDYQLTKDFVMYYNLGAWNEKIDDSNIQAQKVTFSFFANRDDVLALNIDKIPNTKAGEPEPVFTPVGNAKITYNGVQTPNPRMSQYGMYLAVSDMTSGAQTKAVYGDKVHISGVWKYTGNNKFYDFGDITYKYNGGGTWEEFEPGSEVEYDMAKAKIYDIFELTNLSRITMRKGEQFNLADLKTSSNVGMKLKLKKVKGEVIFTLGKDVANNVWVNSGYEIKLVPEVSEIRIITMEPQGDGSYEEVIRARVSNIDYSKPIELEFAVADMFKKGTKKLAAHCVYAKINGEECIRWIDTDLKRVLGQYSAAWAQEETIIYSVGYKGYVPVDKNVGVKDFFDVSGYAETKITPSACVNLGEMDAKNSAVKMRVRMTKDTEEFKLAIGKIDTTTIWDIAESGYQFWFRPGTNQVFIGYGMSEYATMVSHEYSENFILEVGAKDVYHENGKYYGYMVYIKIDGKEVTSWVDKNVNQRAMGKAVVAYGSADSNIVVSTLYPTHELPVVYMMNDEPKSISAFASVQSKVVLGKPSKITVTTTPDSNYSMTYKGTTIDNKQLKEVEVAVPQIGEYTYEATAKQGDKVVVAIDTKKLVIDEAEKVLDIYEVMKVPSLSVQNSQAAHLGSTVGPDGRHRINTAVQMKVIIPSQFNQIRWSMFSDQSSMWGYNGFIVKLLNNKIAICYSATERKLAEYSCDLVKPNTTLYVESGAVKVYENGTYKYDRYYVKVGETLESMKLACWYDSRERGSYGTTIAAYGMDVPQSYTISGVGSTYTITDASDTANKAKLKTYEAFGTTQYEVYYPTSVSANQSAAIKLYVEDGKKLSSLMVGGQNVISKVKKSDDGGYVYEIPSVKSNITFSYVIR